MKAPPSALFTLVGSLTLCACGQEDTLALSDPHRPFQEGATTVIGGDGSMPIATGQLTEDGCLQVTAETCIAVERAGRYCTTNEGPADVVVAGGVVREVVCYEDTDSSEGPAIVVDGDGDGDLDVPQQDNGAVITFGEASNGKPIPGNVVVDGNNVTIYGNGPDNSIIDGNLVITGNNARVRGVRVRGNVEIALNTAALVLSVVEGNLQVSSNNVLIAENDVFGNVQVSGNNAILVANDAGQDWQITGASATCESNRAFDDGDANRMITDEERGELLTCPE